MTTNRQPYGGNTLKDYEQRAQASATQDAIKRIQAARNGSVGYTADDLALAVRAAVNDALKEIDLVIEVWRTSFDIEKDYPSDLHSADVLDKHIFPALASWTETDTRTINALREDIRKQEERLLLAVRQAVESEREACVCSFITRRIRV
jgi:hypothetical protein